MTADDTDETRSGGAAEAAGGGRGGFCLERLALGVLSGTRTRFVPGVRVAVL